MMMILLDNGHGKETKGKCSPKWADNSQLFEWEFNRDIVKRIYMGLMNKGIDSYIIVPETSDIDLVERVKRVNDYVRRVGRECLLVSIHSNAGGGKGWEIFTSQGQTRSDKYADIFIEEAKRKWPTRKIRTDFTDGDGDKEAQFYILRKTICPAVLTENFFMDTEEDCKYIMSEEGRREIADMHIKSIMRCINGE